MHVFEHPIYQEDINHLINLELPWDKLSDRALMITGSTGMIGSMLIDAIMRKNQTDDLNCTIYALGRSQERMQTRFEYCYTHPRFIFVPYEASKPINFIAKTPTIDYVMHLASNTHPKQYATDPISTITTNIIGLQHLLNVAVQYHARRFIFASSVEIYGENRGDTELFDETYCGYLDPNTLRAGYPESKRCGEALCQAYYAQHQLDIVIPRLPRTYGPTLLKTDTKALSQFLHNAISGEDIILKSAGNQYYSYLYAADSVSGLLTTLLKGKAGEAYNISDIRNDIRLKDLANLIAQQAGTEVIYEQPDIIEQAGYSTATIARLDPTKIQQLGWHAQYDTETGIKRTITILGQIQ